MTKSSIRRKLIFALILVLGATFYLVSVLTGNLISASLLRNTAQVQMEAVERQAVSLGEKWNETADTFYTETIEAARKNGGRLFVVDSDGKIIVDSFNERIGCRVTEQEIYDVLSNQKSASYAFYQDEEDGIWDWKGYFITAILDNEGRMTGALILIRSIRETVETLRQVRMQMLIIFAAAIGVVFAATVLITRVVTKPVKELSEGIRRMGEGDFTQKVHVKGNDEMAQLAAAFNQMEDQVRNLDETRNQFVSNASHEIKTPLTTMKILVENILYEEEMDPETQKEFLTDIDKEIDRLNSMVSDLLTLAHVDSHKLRIKRDRMYFADTVRESMERLQPMAKRHQVEMSCEILDECEMIGDAGKLGQVCYNIISNAIKYTPANGTIQIHLNRDRRNAILEVRDTGIGIPEEELPNIFDRFYRVDKARARTSEEGGTGLGLSIVRQMVRLHAGTVTVSSKLGAGSTFTVILPIMSATEGGNRS